MACHQRTPKGEGGCKKDGARGGNLTTREETKGQVRKRMVLANVSSFRLLVPGEHANVPSFWFLATGKYECREVRVYPTECCEQLGRDPSKKWEL